MKQKQWKPNTIKRLKKKKSKKPVKVLACIDEYAQKLRLNMTPAEIEVVQWLKHYNINFKPQIPIFTGKHWYIVDFVIKAGKRKVCIEVDGGYHLIPEVKKEDKERDKQLHKLGYTVFRITNKDVFKDPIQLIGILQFLGIKCNNDIL